MTDSTNKASRWTAVTFALAVACAGVACEDAPSAPDSDANVQIDLAPYFSGFGAGRKAPCSEADTVFLVVSELDREPTEVQAFSHSVPPCTAVFTVTVKGGQTEFAARVLGNGRSLLAGDSTIPIQDDGWSLELPLTLNPALDVSVDTSADTTGMAPTAYTYTVTTQRSPTSSPFAVAAGATDTVAALAAGDVVVQLFGFGTCNVSPDSVQTVAIPVGADSLGSVTFGVDCNNVQPTGTVRVITMTSGTGGPDPYQLVVGMDTLVVGRNDTVFVTGVPVGDQLVELINAVGCKISPSNPQTVLVTEGDTVDVTFTINATLPCGQGSIEVVTMTTGSGGPSSYNFMIDSMPAVSIGTDDSNTAMNVPAGMRTVRLLNFAPCSVSPDSIQSADVKADSTVQIVFDVNCTSSGAIGVITNTSGPDSGDYEVQVAPDTAITIAPNDTVIINNLSPGSRQIFLANTAPCLVTSPNPDTVSVVAGDTTFITFDVECSPQIQVQTRTVGRDLDPDGYAATVVDSMQTQPIAINASVVFTPVSSGSHTVQLTGVSSNCIVIGGPTRTAVVGASGTATVKYTIECFVQSSWLPGHIGDAMHARDPADRPARHAFRIRRSS